MDSTETKCQCHKCNEIFSYSQLPDDVKMRHVSPCCKASYSVLNRSLDQFFMKFLDINNDKKYYEYKKKGF